MNKQPEVRARTRQKLIDAFWKLCSEKSINRISVGEVTRLAGYNRSTFYEYFTDMPDLVHQVEDSILENVRESVSNAVACIDQIDLNKNMDAFQIIFRMLNGPIYFLLGPNGDPAFFSRVKEAVFPILADSLGVSENSAYFDYITAYAYSALVGFLQHWHEQGQNLPEQEFLQLGFDLLAYGVFGALAKKNEIPEADPSRTSQ